MTDQRRGIPEAPLFTMEVCDPYLGLQGWVVVHTLGSHCSCGGVRMVDDVTREEVMVLARVMTYKYCFHWVIDRGGGLSLGARHSAAA